MRTELYWIPRTAMVFNLYTVLAKQYPTWVEVCVANRVCGLACDAGGCWNVRHAASHVVHRVWRKLGTRGKDSALQCMLAWILSNLSMFFLDHFFRSAASDCGALFVLASDMCRMVLADWVPTQDCVALPMRERDDPAGRCPQAWPWRSLVSVSGSTCKQKRQEQSVGCRVRCQVAGDGFQGQRS